MGGEIYCKFEKENDNTNKLNVYGSIKPKYFRLLEKMQGNYFETFLNVQIQINNLNSFKSKLFYLP